MNEKKTTIRTCARCGKDHVDLVFKPFAEEQIDDMTHWALCPTNGEPILLKVVVDESRG